MKDAYKLLADVLRLYKEEFQGTPLALFTGFDQAACRNLCQPVAKLADGTAVEYGAVPFLANQSRVCKAGRDRLRASESAARIPMIAVAPISPGIMTSI